MTGRRPIVDYDEEGPFIRLSSPDAAVEPDPAANPGWWETAINSGDYGWDGDEAPTATDNRTATP